MQKHRIAIRFTVPYSHSLMARLRDCAEDIDREIRNLRCAQIENMDSAIDTLWVRVHSTGKLPAILKVIEKCIGDAGLWDCTETVIDPDD